jgi:hypothetical protein
MRSDCLARDICCISKGLETGSKVGYPIKLSLLNTTHNKSVAIFEIGVKLNPPIMQPQWNCNE